MAQEIHSTMAGIPDWLYYTSIAIIIVVSFALIEFIRHVRKNKIPAEGYRKYELSRFPVIKSLIKSRGFQAANQAVVLALFFLILLTGFYGKQLPGENIAPVLTWNIWWIGLIFIVLFFGKLWCYACPWYALSDWLTRLSIFRINKDIVNMGWKWPTALRNIYPATLLFILLTWIELGYNITSDPEATATLGILMFGLVFIPAMLFEKKSFCRYGCLVGRISGLYSMFSPVEVRSESKKICRACRNMDCFSGNKRGYACPTEQNLSTMSENTYCIMCAECFRTCPHDNVGFYLRPFGTDLIKIRDPKKDEAYLALVLFSITAFHGLSMTSNWKILLSFTSRSLSIGYIPSFTIAMILSLSIPVILYALFIGISRKLSGHPSYPGLFNRYAYGLIPIALFYHLAHNVEHFFMEGQKLIVLASNPFGYGWNIFGTAGIMIKPMLELNTVWFIQVALIITGHLFGIYISHRHAHQVFTDEKAAIKSQVPVTVMMMLFSALSLWLIAQPMNMRTGM